MSHHLNRREIGQFNRQLRQATPAVVAQRFLSWYSPPLLHAANRVRGIIQEHMTEGSRAFNYYQNVLGIIESGGINRKTRRGLRYGTK